MAFTLHIDTSNAAFHDDSDGDAYDPGPELARILRGLADTLDGPDRYPDNGTLRDVNGNRVGTWEITEDGTPEPWPTLGSRAVCHTCGDDIEWNGDVWWDRGGNAGGSDGHPHRATEEVTP